MTAPHSALYAALARAFDAGRAAAVALDGRPGNPVPATPEVLATEAMVVMSKVLDDAGCLREPEPPPPAMTLDEAAEVLCRLAQTPRLDPNDPTDVAALSINRSLFEYAWAAVSRAGVNPADADRAHTAHKLLARHHGLR